LLVVYVSAINLESLKVVYFLWVLKFYVHIVIIACYVYNDLY